MAAKLFSNISLNATSGSFIKGDSFPLTIFCWGTFGGATVSVQYSPDGLEWFDDKTGESSFSSKDIRYINLSAGIHVRASITNVGPSTNVSLVAF